MTGGGGFAGGKGGAVRPRAATPAILFAERVLVLARTRLDRPRFARRPAEVIPARSAQAGATFFRQGVGDHPSVSLIHRHASGGTVEHTASVVGAIGAEARHLDRQAIIQTPCDRASDDSHADQHAIVIVGAMPPERTDRHAMVAMMLPDERKGICLRNGA